MIERRNFYRILHVQPDASMAVIRENYRILMQRLKMHPDLSDSNWNEDLLDSAYDTLGNPMKRAMYDQELLRRYHINTLSQGAFSVNADLEQNNQENEYSANWSHRNFYRVLQIQPDAPTAAIIVSYQALKKNIYIDHALLDEAYRTLSNPAARKQYDVFLTANNFSSAAEKPTGKNSGLVEYVNADVMPEALVESYQAMITHYCSFCKTPYMLQLNGYQNDSCLECASPLFTLQHEHIESSRRTLMRINVRGEFVFYPFWPSKPYQGLFQDLSPIGVRFITDRPIDLHDIVKIDASNFRAIGEVTHTHNDGKESSVGLRFIAVKFEQHRGNFIKVEA